MTSSQRRPADALTTALLLCVPLMLGSGWGNPGCDSDGPEPSKTEGRWELVASGPGEVGWLGEGGYATAAPDAQGDFYAESGGHTFVLPCSDDAFLCPLESWLPRDDGLWRFGNRSNESRQRFRHYRACEGEECPGEHRVSRVKGVIDGEVFYLVDSLDDDCVAITGELTFDELDEANDRYTHASGYLAFQYGISCLQTTAGERVMSGSGSANWYEIVQPIEGWYVEE